MKPKLTRVTFTGADDTIDPARLVAFSAEWLQAGLEIEWGILIGSQSGHRFPTTKWILQLLGYARPKLKLSLHICGSYLRAIADGMKILPFVGMRHFQRCQLNWHAEKQGEISANICQAFNGMADYWDPEVIFQLDGANDTLPFDASSKGLKKIAGLFDLSHGAGVLPESWSEHSRGYPFPTGYAGGLGPDNIETELPKIQQVAAGEYWIDMETKLFDGMRFSLVHCNVVAEKVHTFLLDNGQLNTEEAQA